MYITTSRGNTYSYSHQSNEILPGIVEDNYVWQFMPFETFDSMPKVYSFIVSVTDRCNLRCSYCCYSGEYPLNRVHGHNSMTCNDIDKVFKFIEATIPQGQEIRLAFYGGEPLVSYPLLQYAISKARDKWGASIKISISTNGTLLEKEIVDWLIKYHVELAISLDGTKPFHDAHRTDINGKGSYDRVYSALRYIAEQYPQYMNKVSLHMTLASFARLDEIAKEWNEDALLKDIEPANLHGLSPNFSVRDNKANFEQLKKLYTELLDFYEVHKDWLILKVLFDKCVEDWINRPIMKIDTPIPMSTCMPVNTKLYIDSRLDIGVCEKIADKFRIGNIHHGIDWQVANKMAQDYYQKRSQRCQSCPALRMCGMCLTAIEYNDAQWDVLCHNELAYLKLNMYLFCEMAERGMII